MNKLQYEVFKLQGIITDIEPVELMNGAKPSRGVPTPAVWTAGRNVHFDDNSTHRVGGFLEFAEPLPAGAVPVFALNVLTPTQSYWIWVDEQGDTATIWVTDGVTHWDISTDAEQVADSGFDDPTAWALVYDAEVINSTLRLTDSSDPQQNSGATIPIRLSVGETYEVNAFLSGGSPVGSHWVGFDVGGTTTLISPSSSGSGYLGLHTFDITVTDDQGSLRIYDAGTGFGDDFVLDYVTITGKDSLSNNVGEWTGCVLNGVPVLNNAIDAPVWWNGTTNLPVATIPGWPADQICEVIRAYKYHLIALNITRNSVNTPELYTWSDAADPGTIPDEWAATPENEAGENTVSTSDGGLLDGLTLRDDFILYKAHATFMMSYVGGQFVFATRKLFNTSGIQSKNCVTELRGHHWVFADDDLIRHDGNTFQSIADKRIRGTIIKGINPDTQFMAQVVANVSTDEIWFCYPGVDNQYLTQALIYSFTDDKWGTRDLPGVSFVAKGIIPREGIDPTWDGSPAEWDNDIRIWNESTYSVTNDNLLMLSPQDNKIYNVDASVDNNGAPVQAFVERTDWTIGGEGQIWDNVLVQSITPVITGQAGDVITIRMAGTMYPGQPINWSTSTFTIGQSVPKVDILTHGRFVNLRFSSEGGSPWELHRLAIDYIGEGRY